MLEPYVRNLLYARRTIPRETNSGSGYIPPLDEAVLLVKDVSPSIETVKYCMAIAPVRMWKFRILGVLSDCL